MLQDNSDKNDVIVLLHDYEYDFRDADHREKAYFVQNRRGGWSLLFGGQPFFKRDSDNEGTVTSCCTKKSSGCGATVSTLDEFIERVIGSHNHPIAVSGSHAKRTEESDNCISASRETLDLVPNGRGGRSLRFEGQLFPKGDTNTEGVITWRCAKTNIGCRATVFTLNEFIQRVNGSHNHPIATLDYQTQRTGGGDNSDAAAVSTSQNTFELVTNCLGGCSLLFEGQLFSKGDTSNEGIVTWRCARRNIGCRAIVSTLNDFIQQVNGSHSHPLRESVTSPTVDSVNVEQPSTSHAHDKTFTSSLDLLTETGGTTHQIPPAMGRDEQILSTRGQPLLAHEGHLYRRGYQSSTARSWRCIRKYCPCSLVQENQVISQRRQHNHLPNQDIVDVYRMRTRLQRRVATTAEDATSVYAACVRSWNPEMPTSHSIKAYIRRQRQMLTPPLLHPTSPPPHSTHSSPRDSPPQLTPEISSLKELETKK